MKCREVSRYSVIYGGIHRRSGTVRSIPIRITYNFLNISFIM